MLARGGGGSLLQAGRWGRRGGSPSHESCDAGWLRSSSLEGWQAGGWPPQAELRGGQPVVLNVNLEEDIPALLTSLQLSGRVNEAVTRRVRELLQESGEETAP